MKPCERVIGHLAAVVALILISLLVFRLSVADIGTRRPEKISGVYRSTAFRTRPVQTAVSGSAYEAGCVLRGRFTLSATQPTGSKAVSPRDF